MIKNLKIYLRCLNWSCWPILFVGSVMIAKPSHIKKLILEKKEFQNALSLSLTIVDCYDGDTCSGKNQLGMFYKIRLAGIDCPEMKATQGPLSSHLALKARNRIRQLTLGQKVTVKRLGQDIYGRSLGLIYLSGHATSVNETLLNEALAFPFPPRDTPAWALDASLAARRNKQGVWKLSESQTPWLLRKKTKTLSKRIKPLLSVQDHEP